MFRSPYEGIQESGTCKVKALRFRHHRKYEQTCLGPLCNGEMILRSLSISDLVDHVDLVRLIVHLDPSAYGQLRKLRRNDRGDLAVLLFYYQISVPRYTQCKAVLDLYTLLAVSHLLLQSIRSSGGISSPRRSRSVECLRRYTRSRVSLNLSTADLIPSLSPNCSMYI